MLQNAYLVAKIGADTAENEPEVTKKRQKNVQYITIPKMRLWGPAWGRRDGAVEARRRGQAAEGEEAEEGGRGEASLGQAVGGAEGA